jgi:hypothetical protein
VATSELTLSKLGFEKPQTMSLNSAVKVGCQLRSQMGALRLSMIVPRSLLSAHSVNCPSSEHDARELCHLQPTMPSVIAVSKYSAHLSIIRRNADAQHMRASCTLTDALGWCNAIC